VRGLNWFTRAWLGGRVDGGSKSSVLCGKSMGISYHFYGNISGWMSWIFEDFMDFQVRLWGYEQSYDIVLLPDSFFEGCSPGLCIGIVIIHQALKGNHQGF